MVQNRKSITTQVERNQIIRTSEGGAVVNNEQDKLELLDAAIKAFTDCCQRKLIRTASDVLGDVIADFDRCSANNSLMGITTGFSTLDKATGGWQAGDFNILASRPAVGKSAMACNFAIAAAREGKKVGFISAEQPGNQIARRLIAITGGAPAWKMRSIARLHDNEWEMIKHGITEVNSLDITIVDDPAPLAEVVASYARLMQCDLLIVDYIQRLKNSNPKINDYERISASARELKYLAREQGIPVIAVSHINRSGEGGASMEHLHGSGALEQEADSIFILERNVDEDMKKAVLTVEKNRHGVIGKIDFSFDVSSLRFSERHKKYAPDPITLSNAP